MMQERVFFFDIDGTLLRANGAGKKALAMALQSGFAVDKPFVDINFGGRTDISIAREIFQKNGIDDVDANRLKLFEAYLIELERHLHELRAESLPGVLELLNALSTEPLSYLAIITGNIRQGAFAKLGFVALDHFFSCGGFGDHHELRSEIARQGLLEAQKTFGRPFRAEQLIVIGDTPFDVQCARAIGAKSLAVGTGYAARSDLLAAKPDAFLEDFAETERVFDLLFRL